MSAQLPDASGHFGTYGGMFVPETLMTPLQDLAAEYEKAKSDASFQEELDYLLRQYCGRPTPLYYAERWTELLGGAKIYLKREDLLHTGAHKSTMRLDRFSWPSASAKSASSPRPELVSMAWRLRQSVPDSAWNVLFTWELSTWSVRHSTWHACVC